MRLFVLTLVLLLAVSPAWAVILGGRIEQGGLAAGLTEPDSTVTLDGAAVPLDPDGRFLLGFGRDAPPTAVLEIRSADGEVERKTLTVTPRQWPEQRIDGLAADKVTPDAAQLARIRAEADLVAERRRRVSSEALFVTGLALPAEGPVSGVFGSRRVLDGQPRAPHSGTDIAAPEGGKVASAGDGVVVLAHPDLFYTGATVMIDHGLGLVTVYAHLSRIDVAEGRKVAKGEAIGAVGASGRATGPHLHWGISWLDVRLDPETVMTVLGR
jgi:murein DD-endopeptidase MepM/ murein hydrolase activator NlpD